MITVDSKLKVVKCGLITCILGDCEEYMKDSPDEAFGLAIVDPPYGIGAAKMNMGGVKNIGKNQIGIVISHHQTISKNYSGYQKTK